MSLTPYVHVDAPLSGADTGHDVALAADQRRHLSTVLRLRSGSACHVADGVGSHAPALLTDTGARLTAAASTAAPPAPRLTVAQALAKGRKFDDVVRVGTELGADGFVPVDAARSVVRVDGKTDKAVARWAAVGRAASEQSRRPFRPVVEPPVAARALADRDGAAVLLAHPGGVPLHRQVDEVRGHAEVVLAIGPEGGWSDDEVDHLRERGALLVGLGHSVLRTEHAAAAGLAVLGALAGRWDA